MQQPELYTISGVDFAKYNPELDWSGKLFGQYKEISPIRNHTGIYAFTLCDEIVYIGSSTNLFGRFQTHIAHLQGKLNKNSVSVEKRKYYYLNKYLPQVQFKVLEFYNNSISKDELESNEYKLIHSYNPIFNINFKNEIKKWDWSEQNIDDFVNEIISMDKLKMKSNTAK